MRFGADYRRIVPIRRDATGVLSAIADDITSLTDKRNLWLGSTPAVSTATEVTELSLWAQDTWQISPRFLITPGLRWELNPSPDASPQYLFPGSPDRHILRPQSSPALAGVVTPILRLGWALAWRVRKSGRTVVRAGGGLFYDSSLSIATDLINGGPFNITQFTNGVHGLVLVAPELRLLAQSATAPLDRVELHARSGAGRPRRCSPSATSGPPDAACSAAKSAGPATLLPHCSRSPRTMASPNTTAFRCNIAARCCKVFSRWYPTPGRTRWTTIRAMPSWCGRAPAPAPRDRASSDFDLRHSLTAALTYELPVRSAGISRWLGGWAIDSMVRARSGFPISVLVNEQYQGIALANAFRPDRFSVSPSGLTTPPRPGGKRLNRAAFQAAPDGTQGTLGRNSIAGFGMGQVDLALRREFRVPGPQGRSAAAGSLQRPEPSQFRRPGEVSEQRRYSANPPRC